MGWFKKKEIVEKPKVEVFVKGTIKFDGIVEGWNRYLLSFKPDLDITYINNGTSATFKRIDAMHISLLDDYHAIEKSYRKAFELIYDFTYPKEGNAVMEKIKEVIESDVVKHIEEMQESELANLIKGIDSQPINISFKFEL